MHFRQEISPSTDYGFWQSDHRDLLRLCQPPIFVHSGLGLCCISHHLQHSWTAARMALLWPVPFGHIVLFWLSAFSPWSKLRVIIWSMLRFRTTLHIPFANVFPSFELLLHKCPSYAHFQHINGKYILNLIWGNKSKTKKSIPYIRITRKP